MRPRDPKAVEELFNSAAYSYDLLNDLLSFGLHRIWKRQLLKWINPQSGEYWLDLCCGTGDMAFSLAKVLGPNGLVVGIDNAEEPLAFAKRRNSTKQYLSISWQKADALKTGLAANSFDGAVMAYGLRNLYDPKAGLEELYRILKPGSKAGLLDFNRMIKGSIGELFQTFYLRKIVVPIAGLFGLHEHYAYLEKSLSLFPFGVEQERIALEVGFSQATYKKLAWGQMGALLVRV